MRSLYTAGATGLPVESQEGVSSAGLLLLLAKNGMRPEGTSGEARLVVAGRDMN